MSVYIKPEELRSGSAESASATIEETNRLRAALGLKPLGRSESEVNATLSREDEQQRKLAMEAAMKAKVDQDAQNRLERARHARELTGKVVSGTSLGEALAGDDDSAAAFVRRSRKADELITYSNV